MKAIRVSPRAKTLNDLLNKARRRPVILETAAGERFVLASIEGWKGYPLSKDGDMTKEQAANENARSSPTPEKVDSASPIQTGPGPGLSIHAVPAR